MAEDKTPPTPTPKTPPIPAAKPQLTRITFDLPATSVATLKRMQADCYAESLPAVMKKALKLLAQCLQAEKRGAKISITERAIGKEPGKITEISLFLL